MADPRVPVPPLPAPAQARPLLPTFLALTGRKVVLVGGGAVAAGKHAALVAAGAVVTVVAPAIGEALRRPGTSLVERAFEPADLDGAWFVVAAAPPEVNRQVLAAAETRRLFVNAVDDPAAATAYAGGVIRRGDVTVGISTGGRAPALAGLLREALERLLPEDLATWTDVANRERAAWRSAGVPMRDRRPLLLEALNQIYAQTPEVEPDPEPSPALGPNLGASAPEAPGGRVTLIGAGPGDPDLLTLGAARCLADADVILYDALAAPALKALAPEARWLYVGKRAGRESMAQETINRILIREASRGNHVVRLKGGDPFVLGRGGEEAVALANAGVLCTVIPGVSSAIAAPALAGIPVTHRGLSAAFTVVSGHAPSAYEPVLTSLAPESATLVVLMGLGARNDIARLLLTRGWAPSTPAAILCAASTPDAWTWTGTLDGLGAARLPSADPAAGILVVGQVVTLAAVLGPKAQAVT